MATTISRRALVVHGIDFEGFSSVTLAQAGIRGEHAPASGYSAWIPAFAGMTTQWSTSHLHSGHLLNQNAGDSYTAVTTCAAPARRSSVGLTQRSPVNRAPRGLKSPLSAEPGASAPGEKCPNVVRFDLAAGAIGGFVASARQWARAGKLEESRRRHNLAVCCRLLQLWVGSFLPFWAKRVGRCPTLSFLRLQYVVGKLQP